MKRINNCLSSNDHAHLNKASRKFELQEKNRHQGPHSCAKTKATTMALDNLDVELSEEVAD